MNRILKIRSSAIAKVPLPVRGITVTIMRKGYRCFRAGGGCVDTEPGEDGILHAESQGWPVQHRQPAFIDQRVAIRSGDQFELVITHRGQRREKVQPDPPGSLVRAAGGDIHSKDHRLGTRDPEIASVEGDAAAIDGFPEHQFHIGGCASGFGQAVHRYRLRRAGDQRYRFTHGYGTLAYIHERIAIDPVPDGQGIIAKGQRLAQREVKRIGAQHIGAIPGGGRYYGGAVTDREIAAVGGNGFAEYFFIQPYVNARTGAIGIGAEKVRLHRIGDAGGTAGES